MKNFFFTLPACEEHDVSFRVFPVESGLVEISYGAA